MMRLALVLVVPMVMGTLLELELELGLELGHQSRVERMLPAAAQEAAPPATRALASVSTTPSRPSAASLLAWATRRRCRVPLPQCEDATVSAPSLAQCSDWRRSGLVLPPAAAATPPHPHAAGGRRWHLSTSGCQQQQQQPPRATGSSTGAWHSWTASERRALGRSQCQL